MYISPATCQKLFIFGMRVPVRVLFHSTSIDPWVLPWGRARGQNLGSLNKVVYCSLFIQTSLNKEGWALDMFITSTFCVKRSRSLWPYFHAPAILPYTCILKTISWINMILGILVLCDTMIDIIINVGHFDLYFMVQWFWPYILNVIWCMNIIITSQYDLTVDLKVNIGHYDLYFGVQWFYVISWRQLDVWLS